MATFIEEAKELLSEEQFNRFELLRVKSNNFESTQEEEQEFFNLKNKVRQEIINREAMKGLEFLKSGKFSLSQVLSFLKPTEKELKAYIKVNFASKNTESDKEPIKVGTYIFKKNNLEVEEDIIFNGGATRKASRELGDAVRKGGIKEFIKCLTEDGYKWCFQSHIADRGPTTGQITYSNLQQIATRFKWDKADIIKAKQELEAEKNKTNSPTPANQPTTEKKK